MAVQERFVQAPAGWPPAEELARLAEQGGLVLLPDEVAQQPDGRILAAFREEAQAMRLQAQQDGVPVTLIKPQDADLAVYREDAAELVLPIILFAAGIPATLITNRIQRWLDERRAAGGSRRIRYREAHVADSEIRVRELEGPAEDVVEMLRENWELPPRGTTEPGSPPNDG
jgi:hypothetical protein